MSNLMKHAKREFELLPEDAVVKEFEQEILALVDKFGESGQSGASAPYVAKIVSSVVHKLCMFKPLSPLTFDMEEWQEISEFVYQNKRNSAVFMEKEMKPYYLYALVFTNSKESSFTGSSSLYEGGIKRIKSIAYIKDLESFTGESFYVPVHEKEVSPDDWESWLTEDAHKVLDKASEVYDFVYTET